MSEGAVVVLGALAVIVVRALFAAWDAHRERQESRKEYERFKARARAR